MLEAYYQILGVSSFLGFLGCYVVACFVFGFIFWAAGGADEGLMGIRNAIFPFVLLIIALCVFHFHAAIDIAGMGAFETIAMLPFFVVLGFFAIFLFSTIFIALFEGAFKRG